MSRIAGISLPSQHAAIARWVGDMLRLVSPSTISPTTVGDARVSLGHSGRSVNAAIGVNGIATAIDGTIYNREEFPQAETDAAVVGDLYHRYGFSEAVTRLNGDFAIALYDPVSNTLWLARDRFGVKPLYYVRAKEFVAFASRPRSLLFLPGVSSEVNRSFVARFAGLHYRYFDNAPEQSPFAAVSQLPAAHVARIHGGNIVLHPYWRLEEQPDWTDDEGNLAQRYRELLFDAVRCRLDRTGPAVFTLSGGMDSSSVLASAGAIERRREHAISAVYVDRTYDESEEIGTMRDASVDTWHQVTIDQPDVFGLIQRMVAAHDEPVATATWLSHFLICEHASRAGFNVLFGGLGGDELNAGEYEHFIYHFADLRRTGDEGRLAREIERWVEYHNHPIYRKTRAVAETAIERLVDLKRPGVCRLDRVRYDRYVAALSTDYFDLTGYAPVMEHPFSSYLKNRTYQDLTRETVPCCLRAEDRQAVAFGLEHRLPFFDHRLVEFMFRVPGTLKFRDGVSKVLLRHAMKSVLPEETRTRIKKTGWNAPAHRWFSGRGHDLLLDLVNSRSFVERGIYNVPYVLQLIDQHNRIVLTGEVVDNHMMFLWQLVNLEMWFQQSWPHMETHSPVGTVPSLA